MLCYLCACFNLEREIFDTDFGDLLQQVLACLWISIDPCFRFDEQLAATTFHHVTEQGPWRSAEADQWDPPLELMPCQSNSLVDIIQLPGNIDLFLHHSFVLAICWRLERLWEMWSLLVNHLNGHAHGLRDDKNVGENDGGVNETSEALDRLQGQRRRYFWRSTAFEEVVSAFGLMIFWQVSTRCVCDQDRGSS